MRHIRNLLLTFFITLFSVFSFLPVHAGSDVYVEDTYGELSEEEVEELNSYAKEISDKYKFGIYARLLYDEDSYDDINSYIEDYYTREDLGYGESHDGILFLITQSSRGGSYDIYIPGNSNQSYFTIDGLEDIQSNAETYLYDHDYYSSIHSFLSECDDMLSYYEESDNTPWSYDASDDGSFYEKEPVSKINSYPPVILIGIPLLVAVIVTVILASKHKTKHIATDAHNYIPKSGQLRLNTRYDMYLYSTETRTRIPDNDAHSSGGGFTSSSGGMHSGGGHF